MRIMTYGIKRIIENGTINDKIQFIEELFTCTAENTYMSTENLTDYEIVFSFIPPIKSDIYEFYAVIEAVFLDEDESVKNIHCEMMNEKLELITGKGKDLESALTDYINQYFNRNDIYFNWINGNFDLTARKKFDHWR